MHALRFNVYGRIVAIERRRDAWAVWVTGEDGKRRPADFEVPDFIAERELCQYLADLFHEAATPTDGGVRRLP